MQAVCSGFVYAMNVADNFVSARRKMSLVIGAETFSRILDWEDRTTCVLFGDGAGAVVLLGQDASGDSSDRGVLANCLHSDGRHHDLLYVDGGPSATQTVGHLRMEGPEVFKHAVKNLPVIGEALKSRDSTLMMSIGLFPIRQTSGLSHLRLGNCGSARKKLS